MAAYNPVDTLQQKFLAAIALGESPRTDNPYMSGYGNKDLSGYKRDQYGFPIWEGGLGGSTHAAGVYQFQPGTWKGVASQYGLDFSNPADQNAGAWYNAEREFKENTGGDLYQALANGQYDIVQNALTDEWTSVTGNAAAPGGLATSLEKGLGAGIKGIIGNPLDFVFGNGLGQSGIMGGSEGLIGNIFVRAALVIVGVIILVAALWALLARFDVVPAPAELAPGNK
jgi:muramidase (phage lysozyme)